MEKEFATQVRYKRETILIEYSSRRGIADYNNTVIITASGYALAMNGWVCSTLVWASSLITSADRHYCAAS